MSDSRYQDADPIKLAEMLWDYVFYDKQVEIIYSVWNNDETIVRAGNMLGKDFGAGAIAILFALTRAPVRVVTTSVDEGQLRKVLWGEINRMINTAKYALPFKVNDLELTPLDNSGKPIDLSYVIGRVAKKEEGLLGHHLPRGPFGRPHTLVIYDEASGIEHEFKNRTDTWAHRTLAIGNPFPCENFFKKYSKEGPVLDPESVKPKAFHSVNRIKRYYRQVIQIKGEDSPNVKLGLAQVAAGMEPTHEELVPGLLSYREYLKRRATWDDVMQCISLDAEFYEGGDVLMFPPTWLNQAAQFHTLITQEQEKRKREGLRWERETVAMGVDSGQGKASSVWTGVDRLGITFQKSIKTPDTTVIVDETVALIRQHKLKPEMVCFDPGGGGKEHVDRLRRMGYNVRSVSFGGSVESQNKYRFRTTKEKREDDEAKWVFKNRRAEMYWLARLCIARTEEGKSIHMERGFGIPGDLEELRRQLAPVPIWYEDNKLILPPKNKVDPKSKKVTMTDLVGCSPDEADSLVLAVYGMLAKPVRRQLQALA